MSKTYSKKIYDALKENKIKSLSILLEQDDEKTKDTDSSDNKGGGGADDIFNDSDDSKDTEGEAKGETENATEDDLGDEGGNESVDAGLNDESAGDGLDNETLKQSIDQAEKILDNVAKNQDEPFIDIENAADAAIQNAAINASANENFSIIKKYYKTKSIGSFINEADDQKIKKMTDTMSGLEDQLKKYQDTVDDITKGISIHMPTFVREALASLQSFDSKFSKEKIVFNVFRNKLAANSGKSAKENIEEFEKLFYQELNKIDKNVSREDIIIPAEKTHVAVGAMKQG